MTNAIPTNNGAAERIKTGDKLNSFRTTRGYPQMHYTSNNRHGHTKYLIL